MPRRQMLRDMMSVNDIYNFAEGIIELLREEYGSYDADTLDEVQVEESFAQRLATRGYEIRAPEAAPAAPIQPKPAPVMPSIAQDTPVVPVTVVRTRRTTSGPTSGATRTRRTAPSGDAPRPASTNDGPRPAAAASDGTRSATPSEPSRASAESTRPAAESSSEPSADTGTASSETGRPTRTRRTTRTRSSNNGEASS